MTRLMLDPMGDEVFTVEADEYGVDTIWRICGGYNGDDKPVLRRSDVHDADLWGLIVEAVCGE